MLHGHTLAHAFLPIHFSPTLASGQRWLLTDGHVYDWGDLGSPATHGKWVRELMREEGLRALPRDHDRLGRCLYSREFWETFGGEGVVTHVCLDLSLLAGAYIILHAQERECGWANSYACPSLYWAGEKLR
jgi:hypothetical protein